MSTKALNYQPVLLLSVKVKEAVPAKRFIAPTGYLCQSGKIALGVSEIDWNINNNASVISLGTALVLSCDTLAVGDKIASSDSGLAKKFATGDELLGIALNSASNGTIVKVKLT